MKTQAKQIRVCMDGSKVWVEYEMKTKTTKYDVESVAMGANMAIHLRNNVEHWLKEDK